MYRPSAPPRLNKIRSGPARLRYRAIAAALGSAVLAAALAAGLPASAATRPGSVSQASLASAPLPQAAGRLSTERTAVGETVLDSGYTQTYLWGVSALSASEAWAVGYGENATSLVTLTEHWNGKSWQHVKSPNPYPNAPGTAQLRAVKTVSATDAWAVGNYFCPSGSGGTCSQRTLIEHWNGKAWAIVPSPNPTSSDSSPSYNLSGVTAVSADDVWAVGGYDSSPNDNAGLVEHWDGKTWKVVHSPDAASDVELRGVAAVSATDIWAVGDDNARTGHGGGTIVEHWNGHTWSSVHSPSPFPDYSNLYAVAAVSAKDIWAVGGDGMPYTAGNDKVPYMGGPVGNNAATGNHPLIEHWNGTTWQHVSSPTPSGANALCGLHGVDVLSTGNAWAVGNCGATLSTQKTLIEHWNGKSWAIVASPNAEEESSLQAVSGSSASNIWSAGVKVNSGGTYRMLYEKWNGHEWAINS